MAKRKLKNIDRKPLEASLENLQVATNTDEELMKVIDSQLPMAGKPTGIIEEKKLVVVCAPVGTVSGYGARSRDICTALIDSGKYDVKIIPISWGATPNDALRRDNKKHNEIINRLVQKVERQPDIFIHITIPVEFQKVGKLSIGITAGIETTICKHDWLIGCNKMDKVLVSSNHSKTVFATSTFDYKPKEGSNEPKSTLKLMKPIEVIFEGADTNIYKKINVNDIDKEIAEELSDIKENFAFLVVGHWLQGQMGHDRKDIGMTIKAFCDTFKTKPPSKRPAMIVKTSGATFSQIDRQDILNKFWAIFSQYPEGQRPNVYFLHGDLSDAQMNSLYNHPKVKAMVSFTKGEGFGRPLLEFSMTGKPIICSNWSGPIDFLSEKHSVLLPGNKSKVHPSAVNEWVIPESEWFTVDYGTASLKMHQVFSDYDEFLKLSKVQGIISRREFSLEAMQIKLVQIIEDTWAKNPIQPDLRQLAELPDRDATRRPSEQIRLPRLKKV